MLRVLPILILLFLLGLTAPAQSAQSSTLKGQGDTTQQHSNAGDAALIESIRRGDLPLVLKLIENGASPDATDGDGALALCWAVRVNRPDIVKALLAKKAKVNKEETGDGSTALQVAAGSGRAEMVKLLLAHGADVNHKDSGGHTALMGAASGAMVKGAPAWMAKTFFEVDEDDELFTTMGSEHILAAQLLLSAGADANAQAEDCSLTPLMITAMSGNVELAKILLAHRADVNIKSGGRSALKFAEEFGSQQSILKELEDFDDDESKQGVLNWVQFTASGRQEVAKLLRKAGAR